MDLPKRQEVRSNRWQSWIQKSGDLRSSDFAALRPRIAFPESGMLVSLLSDYEIPCSLRALLLAPTPCSEPTLRVFAPLSSTRRLIMRMMWHRLGVAAFGIVVVLGAGVRGAWAPRLRPLIHRAAGSFVACAVSLS